MLCVGSHSTRQPSGMMYAIITSLNMKTMVVTIVIIFDVTAQYDCYDIFETVMFVAITCMIILVLAVPLMIIIGYRRQYVLTSPTPSCPLQ